MKPSLFVMCAVFILPLHVSASEPTATPADPASLGPTCALELWGQYGTSVSQGLSPQIPTRPYLGVLAELLCEKSLDLLAKQEEHVNLAERLSKQAGVKKDRDANDIRLEVVGLKERSNAVDLAWAEVQTRHLEQLTALLRTAARDTSMDELQFWKAWYEEEKRFQAIQGPILKLANELSEKLSDAQGKLFREMQTVENQIDQLILGLKQSNMARITRHVKP